MSRLVVYGTGHQDTDLWYDPGRNLLYYIQSDELRTLTSDFQNTSLVMPLQMSNYNGIAVDYQVGVTGNLFICIEGFSVLFFCGSYNWNFQTQTE